MLSRDQVNNSKVALEFSMKLTKMRIIAENLKSADERK